jgi:DNA-binding Lrp family transcriptional regulator
MTQSNNLLGSNINLVKSHNIRAVLLSLLQDGPISRVELAEKLSLSNTTITNLISELLDQGIILEEEVEIHEKQRRVGRPRRMLRLVPSARYAIGVHIGVGIFRVAITDLFAEIIYNEIATFDLANPPENVIKDIVRLIESAIEKSKIERERVIGVGIGASGLVNYEEGINVLAPRLGWENVPIQHLMENQLDLPVCVDNNVRTMALAEAFFGDGREPAFWPLFMEGSVWARALLLMGRFFAAAVPVPGRLDTQPSFPRAAKPVLVAIRGASKPYYLNLSGFVMPKNTLHFIQTIPWRRI